MPSRKKNRRWVLPLAVILTPLTLILLAAIAFKVIRTHPTDKNGDQPIDVLEAFIHDATHSDYAAARSHWHLFSPHPWTPRYEFEDFCDEIAGLHDYEIIADGIGKADYYFIQIEGYKNGHPTRLYMLYFKMLNDEWHIAQGGWWENTTSDSSN